MILVINKMKARPEKCRELLQTLSDLGGQIQNKRGCLSHHCYQDVENNNAFILIQEWETQADLDNHIRSDLFGVLLGAMSLLSEPLEIKFNTVLYVAGMEAVEEVRKHAGLQIDRPERWRNQ